MYHATDPNFYCRSVPVSAMSSSSVLLVLLLCYFHLLYSLLFHVREESNRILFWSKHVIFILTVHLALSLIISRDQYRRSSFQEPEFSPCHFQPHHTSTAPARTTAVLSLSTFPDVLFNSSNGQDWLHFCHLLAGTVTSSPALFWQRTSCLIHDSSINIDNVSTHSTSWHSLRIIRLASKMDTV